QLARLAGGLHLPCGRPGGTHLPGVFGEGGRAERDGGGHGQWTLTATAAVTVQAGAFAQYGVSAPLVVPAGSTFGVSLTAVESFGNVAAGFLGTVPVSSTDGAARLPGEYTFVAGDQGVHTFFGVVLRSSLNQTLTARDSVDGLTAGMASVSVSGVAVTQ